MKQAILRSMVSISIYTGSSFQFHAQRQHQPRSTSTTHPSPAAPTTTGWIGTGPAFEGGDQIIGRAAAPTTIRWIGTGLTFDDGEQLLVSAQKPLGIVLEEREVGGAGGGCIVADIVDQSSAVASAGVQAGDWLVAVQNADVSYQPIEEVLDRIGKAPRVVNLRFQRAGPLEKD